MSQDVDNELTQQVHPLAAKAVQSVVLRKDGAQSAVPAVVMASLKMELRGRLEEPTIFEHLCVMWWRLNDGGLKLAAKQMLELATIGLKAAELDAAVMRSEQLRSAGKSIQSQATAGATAAAPTSSGVGFRQKPKPNKKP